MAAQTVTLNIEDATLNSGQAYEWITDIDAGYILTGFDVTFNVGIAGVEDEGTRPGWINGSTMSCGVQVVPSGDAIAGPVGDPDSPQWLSLEYVSRSDTMDFFLSATADTDIYLYQTYSHRVRWRGQYPIPGGSSLYLHTGSASDPVASWAVTGVCRAYYDILP